MDRCHVLLIIPAFLCAHPFHVVLGLYTAYPPKATRLAIEAHNGLAPPRWMGGPFNHLGTVAAARTDGRDFKVQDWAVSSTKPGPQGLGLCLRRVICSCVQSNILFVLGQKVRPAHDGPLFSPRSHDLRHHRVRRVLASYRTIEYGVSVLALGGNATLTPLLLQDFVQQFYSK